MIVVAYLKTYFRAALAGRQQKLFGTLDTHTGQVIDDGNIHLLLEDVRQPRNAQMRSVRDVGQRNLLIEIRVYVIYCRTDLRDFSGILRTNRQAR